MPLKVVLAVLFVLSCSSASAQVTAIAAGNHPEPSTSGK